MNDPLARQKVDVADLRIGMYICALDRPWIETPFIFQGFEIRSEQELLELRRYCRHVYIITSDQRATANASSARDPAAARPTPPQSERAIRLEHDLLKLNNHPSANSPYEDITSLEEEIERVREHYAAARALAFSLMDTARLGRRLDVPAIREAVGGLVDSVLRNPDALACFIQLKRKHEYTAQHSLRVCILALLFGRQLGLDYEPLNALGIGALLHDIGKAHIPLGILDKPTALTAEELEIMRSHVPKGVSILQATPGVPATSIEVARGHHERYDGRGYMLGLKGEQIPAYGMIGAITDYYDAMTSDRPYRGALSPHTALKRMYEGRGSAFDPKLVEHFIQCLGIYPVGSVVELNTGELGVVATLNRLRRLKPRVVLVQDPHGAPLPLAPAVNLEHRLTPEGRPCEIRHVLEPETCGVRPAIYLPVPALA